jgi:hypothetical protein
LAAILKQESKADSRGIVVARDAMRKRPFVEAATPDNGGLLLG